ncbi:fucolectin-like isoform X2 [Tachypleus tridentatus]|uniref:fucolectin-like isoform X2 n=1 Tax=Tachypleus tridentatus TaxID=6853 RepID=UPI003FD55C50
MFTISTDFWDFVILSTFILQNFGDSVASSCTYTKHNNDAASRQQRLECGAKCNLNISCYGFTFYPSNDCNLLHLGDLLPDAPYHIKPLDIWLQEATTNVAEGALATQSTLYHSSFQASMCVDGRLDCGHSLISHTANEKFPWWSVDLGAIYTVRKVVIWNTQHTGYVHRLHDFEIRVGNVPVTEVGKRLTANPLCSKHVGGGITIEPVTFVCDQPYPVGGRYVSIQIIQYCSGCSEPTQNYLHMCEVKVYGYKM